MRELDGGGRLLDLSVLMGRGNDGRRRLFFLFHLIGPRLGLVDAQTRAHHPLPSAHAFLNGVLCSQMLVFSVFCIVSFVSISLVIIISEHTVATAVLNAGRACG